MKNPLSTKFSDSINLDLVKKSLDGDKKALNQLIKIHEPFIYNVAWKYTNNQEEAKDLTQEVLIKIVTKLSSFEGKSAFQTWVYRIVVNQFLQTKRRPMEDRWVSFDAFSTCRLTFLNTLRLKCFRLGIFMISPFSELLFYHCNGSLYINC